MAQEIVLWLIVAFAAIFVARAVVRQFRGGNESGSCSKCALNDAVTKTATKENRH